MAIEVTIDDPVVYKQPFSTMGAAKLMQGAEHLEYVCPENNQNLESLKVLRVVREGVEQQALVFRSSKRSFGIVFPDLVALSVRYVSDFVRGLFGTKARNLGHLCQRLFSFGADTLNVFA